MLTVIILVLINLSFIGVGLPNSLLGSAWPSMQGEVGVPVSYMGILSMLYLGGSVFANFFSGKLLKRFAPGNAIFVNLLVIALSLFGFSVAGHFLLLCLFALPLGIGIGFADAMLNSYSAMHFSAKHMNWHHCFWGIGAAVGPVFMAFGMSAGSWRIGYQISGAVVAFIVVAMLLSLPLWKKFAQTAPVAQSTAEPGHPPESYGSLFGLRGFKLSMAIFFVYVAAEATVGLWGASYLVIARGMPPELAAVCLSLYFVGMTLGRFLSGFLSILLSSRQILWLGCALFGCGIVFLVLPLGEAAFWLGFFLMGFGCAPVFPTLVHITPARFGAAYAQTAIGVQMSSSNIGGAAVPPLFGLVAAQIGHGFFPVFLGAMLAIMAVMIWRFDKIPPYKDASS